MKDEWYNNAISKKLHEEYPKDFSICDVDGLVRFSYWRTRLIVYESKWENEKKMGDPQKKSLITLDDAIDWSKFDSMSGCFVLQIVDLENEIRWFNMDRQKVRTTTFKGLYEIFSGKDVKE